MNYRNQGGFFKKYNNIIYEQYFKRINIPKYNTLKEGDIDFEKMSNDILSKTNRKSEKGWNVESMSIETGFLVAEKNNYEKKLIFPGHFLNQSLDFPFKAENKVEVSWFKTVKFNFDESFIYLHGHSIPDDYIGDVNQIRFYLNFIANEDFKKLIPLFLTELISEFNLKKIPIQIKILTNIDLYKNSDTAVIYIENRYFFSAIEIIYKLFQNPEYQKFIAKHSSMFVREIIEGLGFAENPPIGQHSFGQVRSSYLAQMIVKFISKNNKKPTLKYVLKQLKKFSNGFYLNKNSYYPYDFYYASERLKMQNSQFPNIKTSDKQKILEVAQKVGYIICKEAIFDKNKRCNWIGFVPEKKTLSYFTLNYNVIEGVAGIAFFLGELYSITKENILLPFIVGALNTINDNLNSQFKPKDLGFYNGAIGAVYVLLKVAKQIEIYDDINLTQFKNYISNTFLVQFQNNTNSFRIKNTNNNLPPEYFDIYEGLAGQLLGLIKIHSFIDDTNAQANLKSAILDMANELYSINENIFLNGTELVSTGYTRGLGGIGYALTETGKFLNNNKFTTRGLDVILFEIRHISKDSFIEIGWDKTNSIESYCLALNGFISNKENNAEISNALFMAYKEHEIKKLLSLNPGIDPEIFYVLTGSMGLGTLELLLEMNKNFSLNVTHIYNKIYEELIFNDTQQKINDETYSFKKSPSGRDYFQANILNGWAGVGYGFLRIYSKGTSESLLMLKQ